MSLLMDHFSAISEEWIITLTVEVQFTINQRKTNIKILNIA